GAMVAEADRNLVSEVTNLLVLGGAGDAKVFDQMPMTIGGTAPRGKDRTDPTLKGTNPQLPPGTVTDAEVDVAKRRYEEAKKEPLATMIERDGPTPGTRALIKDTLRSLFVELDTSGR